MNPTERNDQRIIAAIPKSDPYQPPRIRRDLRKLDEIVILADDDPTIGNRPRANGCIVGSIQLQIDHLLAIMAKRAKEMSQAQW